MIQVLSRYTITSEERDGNVAIIAVRKSAPTTSYSSHRARNGDTFENLAARYLGSSLFYWKIADLNPQVPFPDYIPAGTNIRIPR
jgi:nucleoid-associated protein YgaU